LREPDLAWISERLGSSRAYNRVKSINLMNTKDLTETARLLVARDKGLLAMDESNPTCNNGFAKQGIP